jgi:hypothetical protein
MQLYRTAEKRERDRAERERPEQPALKNPARHRRANTSPATTIFMASAAGFMREADTPKSAMAAR